MKLRTPALTRYNTGASKKFRLNFGTGNTDRQAGCGVSGSTAFGQEDADQDQGGTFQQHAGRAFPQEGHGQ